MVNEGMGYAIGLDKIINTSCTGNLCFKPLLNQANINMSFAWKKYQVFTKASQRLLDKIQKEL